MDGFFVAKFKVDKRLKKMAAAAEEEEPQMMLNTEGELVEEAKATFDDEADQGYIEGGCMLTIMGSDDLQRVNGNIFSRPKASRSLLKLPSPRATTKQMVR